MRSCDQDFSEFRLKIGNGVINSFKIPENWKSSDICTTIYGSTISERDNLSNHAILSCHNDDVYRLNDKILKKINNQGKIYYSIDYAKYKGMIVPIVILI